MCAEPVRRIKFWLGGRCLADVNQRAVRWSVTGVSVFFPSPQLRQPAFYDNLILWRNMLEDGVVKRLGAIGITVSLLSRCKS